MCRVRRGSRALRELSSRCYITPSRMQPLPSPAQPDVRTANVVKHGDLTFQMARSFICIWSSPRVDPVTAATCLLSCILHRFLCARQSSSPPQIHWHSPVRPRMTNTNGGERASGGVFTTGAGKKGRKDALL